MVTMLFLVKVLESTGGESKTHESVTNGCDAHTGGDDETGKQSSTSNQGKCFSDTDILSDTKENFHISLKSKFNLKLCLFSTLCIDMRYEIQNSVVVSIRCHITDYYEVHIMFL